MKVHLDGYAFHTKGVLCCCINGCFRQRSCTDVTYKMFFAIPWMGVPHECHICMCVPYRWGVVLYKCVYHSDEYAIGNGYAVAMGMS